MSPVASYIVETFVTLLGVIALAVLVLYGGRRLGSGARSGPLELVGRLPLDARRAVYLVKVGKLVYVVGASEEGSRDWESSTPMPCRWFQGPIQPNLRRGAATSSPSGKGEMIPHSGAMPRGWPSMSCWAVRLRWSWRSLWSRSCRSFS